MATPNSTCATPECNRPVRTKGLCAMHYNRLHRTGTTAPRKAPTVEQRFWAKVNKAGPLPEFRPELGQCWVWKAAQAGKGYGVFSVNRRMTYAHRFSYELVHGAIPDGTLIDHECHNILCVRPTHLRPLTNKQNTEHRYRLNSNNTTGATGVVRQNGAWVAQVKHNGIRQRIGRFSSFKEAKQAAETARAELFTHTPARRTA